MAPKCVIHWFRKGLRLHDNLALLKGLNPDKSGFTLEVRFVFVLDPQIAKILKVGPNRWRFLRQTLQDLDEQLQKLGSRLFVCKGRPENVFPILFKIWNVSRLTFESDIEPYSVVRDEKIRALAKEFNVEVIESSGHTLHNPALIVKANKGKAPLTYQKFLSVFDSMTPPTRPLGALVSLKESQKLSPNVYNEEMYGIPTLADLGVDEDALGECLFPGGETEALRRMESYIEKEDYICKFEKPNTSPNSLEPSTTVLSPYLKFGCLSAKLFYYKLKEVIRKRNHSKPPVSLLGQLFWREFYYVAAYDTPNFDKMVGNPICIQVPWTKNDKYLEAWTHGKTGYPFIDAIMRQLRTEGWIHHLARHAVACFLTRGDLWISWEEGQAVFEELLLDADWALNAGNWMWLSASAFFHQYFRVYSPVAFGKKTDPHGDYIKKFVPELRQMPSKYIYEPWDAPMDVQKRAGCVLGKDYPRRIVKHEEIYKKNIAKMTAAYKDNKVVKEQKRKMKESPKKSKKNK